jgi:glycosyltransferase involved in cell wall biosynthesis
MAFPAGAEKSHHAWLTVVAESDGCVCISKTVADELLDWFKAYGSTRQRPFKIDWFHLGADVENSRPSLGLPNEAGQVLDQLSTCPTFLTVGTIESRKGQAQTLAAFEQLWSQGIQVNLVIVGKQGWMVENLVEKLRNHPERSKRLFWLEGISDEYLEKVYAASTCLIAPSEGEGFGLPLIEAAQHKLPIIARDIPVFREVAGEYAYYFSGLKANDLEETIKKWLKLNEKEQAPTSENLPWLTWEQSTKQLLANILPVSPMTTLTR